MDVVLLSAMRRFAQGIEMATRNLLISTLAGMMLAPAVASADIIIETYDVSSAPDPLGGYDMTAFAAPTNTGGTATSAASPIDGQVEFMEQDESGSLTMTIEDSGAENHWWEWDHGNVYTTPVHWVELIMPANTRAFSFFVGASFTGSGWIEAYDSSGAPTPRQHFNLSAGNTPGFGVYTTDSCQAISKIIVEPRHWGMGNFAINQDPCVTVPEPAPITLLGIGLLGLALSRCFRKPATLA